MSQISKKPLHLVLIEPVIPQNTGSIARLCACTGAVLHLIRPLGFDISAAAVKRAGLDYWDYVDIFDYENWADFIKRESPKDLHFFSKMATRPYTEATYQLPSYLIFGSETKGLAEPLWLEYSDRFLQIPMRTHLVRSLNLAQSVAVAAYEVIRQSKIEV